MPDLLAVRPDPSEHAAYFSRYINLVPDENIVGTLATQIAATLRSLRDISDADSLKRYAPGKWSVREVLGHMIDTERIFAYRALRIARNDHTNLPGFEQDDYIAAANFDAPGQVVCIVEAMKMENEIATHRGGVVAGVSVAVGMAVSIGQPICAIDVDGSGPA